MQLILVTLIGITELEAAQLIAELKALPQDLASRICLIPICDPLIDLGPTPKKQSGIIPQGVIKLETADIVAMSQLHEICSRHFRTVRNQLM